ncbi:MAG: hypothetical protein ACF8Q5_00325 [Phycisphaerales bacterium JB040]
MNILYDGTPLHAEKPGVAGALEAARLRAASDDRLLTRVLADGEPLSDELLDRPPATDAEIRTLEVFSERTSDVLVESLRGASEALSGVKSDQTTAAEHLQAGEIHEALPALARVLETWMMVRTIVGQAGELGGLDLNTLQITTGEGQSTGAEMITGLAERLQAVRQAMSGEDWGGLSDELAYELSDQADAWSGMVGAMAGRIRA